MKIRKKNTILLTGLAFFTLFVFVLLGFVTQNEAFGYPKPAFVPPGDAWQLDLELHGEPTAIWITLPGQDQPKRFWYLLYKVTNNTGKDVDFYPQFDLMTNTLRLYHAGVGVRRPVFDAIREQYATSLPLLEPENMVTGRILVGADNARDSVAIFSDFDHEAISAKVFIAGLSNETVSVKHPTEIDLKTGKLKEVLLRKTLLLQYQIVGDPLRPYTQSMLYRSREWIMR